MNLVSPSSSVIIIAVVVTFKEHNWPHLFICNVYTYRNNAELFNAITVLIVKNQIAEAVHRHQSAYIAPCGEHIAALCAVLHSLNHLYHEVSVHVLRMM